MLSLFFLVAASLLIDLMVKNQLHNKCNGEMEGLLGQFSTENKDSLRQNFPPEILSKGNLSANAQ